jgi:uncharacterized membrane protein YphA (DoxX/SURF4 family)
MKILAQIIRILVAATFIFSGFVKLVDPIGSDIKMKEYLSPEVLNIPFLIPYTLLLAVLLILAELVLGIMLMVGFKPKLTLVGITLLMLVFLFLTWYSAYYNKVTDCGCFGEAVKLGTWETFYKNVMLIIFIVFLWIKVRDIKPFLSYKIALWTSFLGLFGGLYLSYYVLQHLPIIDFTPYKVGVNIPKSMEYKEGVEVPAIHDFIFENDTEDLTELILQSDKVLLIISENLAISRLESFTAIKKLTDEALKKGYKVYAISASSMQDFDFVKQKYGLAFDMLYGDGTTIKTMIRANPGIMTLSKGIITGKWNANDTKKVKI